LEKRLGHMRPVGHLTLVADSFIVVSKLIIFVKASSLPSPARFSLGC